MIAKEIRVWSNLRHPNVLMFLGYALEGGDYPLLVSEWMENGNALDYVKKYGDGVDRRDLVRLPTKKMSDRFTQWSFRLRKSHWG